MASPRVEHGTSTFANGSGLASRAAEFVASNLSSKLTMPVC
jgi:hypothetical protein